MIFHFFFHIHQTVTVRTNTKKKQKEGDNQIDDKLLYSSSKQEGTNHE